MEEDSTYNILDMTNIAGRFFLGLVKFLTDITVCVGVGGGGGCKGFGVVRIVQLLLSLIIIRHGK